MNLVILSSIPKFAMAFIVIEAIVMMTLGGFLVADIIRSRIQEVKKERMESKERNIEAAKKSMEYDEAKEEDVPEEAKAHISYLERLNAQQKEYVLLLEKELKLRKELQEMGADVPLASDVNNYVAPEDEDDEFAAFIDSVPEKENEEVVETVELAPETETEAIEESLETEAEELTPVEEPKEIQEEPKKEQVVITASSFNNQAKVSRTHKKSIEEIFNEEDEVINFRIIDPWYKSAPRLNE